MKYTYSVPFFELRQKYDTIIGWADEFVELERNYSFANYQLDFLLSHVASRVGSDTVCGYQIKSFNDIKDYIYNQNVLVVLFSNREYTLIPHILNKIPNADIIISRLVISNSIRPHSYSRDCEDLFFSYIIDILDIDQSLSYADIGVCHPVVRNNTYLLYERGFYNGILVEPNPLFSNYISEYRPLNTLLTCGATVDDCELSYISRISDVSPGLNFFIEDGETFDSKKFKGTAVPCYNINRILSNMKTEPFLLDLDVEGMDLELLKEIDFDRFNFQIICTEPGGGGRKHLPEMKAHLSKYNYIHFTSTLENAIFLKSDIFSKIKSRAELC